MSARRFRYALEPLLLKRRWTLEARQADLADLNAHIKQEQMTLETRLTDLESVSGHAQRLGAPDLALSVDALMLASRYLEQCRRHVRAQEAKLEDLDAARRALLDAIWLAQRELDATKEHRQREQAAFRLAGQKKEYAELDELWNSRSAEGPAHVS